MVPLFARRLDRALELDNRTAAAVAAAAEIEAVTLSHYRRGRSSPNPEVIRRLCEVLKTSPYWILGLRGGLDRVIPLEADIGVETELDEALRSLLADPLLDESVRQKVAAPLEVLAQMERPEHSSDTASSALSFYTKINSALRGCGASRAQRLEFWSSESLRDLPAIAEGLPIVVVAAESMDVDLATADVDDWRRYLQEVAAGEGSRALGLVVALSELPKAPPEPDHSPESLAAAAARLGALP